MRRAIIAFTVAFVVVLVCVILYARRNGKPATIPAEAFQFPDTFVPVELLPVDFPTNAGQIGQLEEQYGKDNLELRVSFFLRFNAFLNSCAGGRVQRSRFYMWVWWRVTSDKRTIVVDRVEDASSTPGAPDEGNLTVAQRQRVLACARDFCAGERLKIPDDGEVEDGATFQWAIPARLPVTDSEVYKYVPLKERQQRR